MVKHVLNWVALIGLTILATNISIGQTRYVDGIFTDVMVTENVPYAQQISILTGAPDTIPLVCDIYQPMGDTTSNRPVMVIAGTGNFLPRLFNGSPTGTWRDSAQVELALELAKRGYVAISYYYRQGWDALNDNVTAQTQSLLQATYRGIQDSRTLARWLRMTADTAMGNPYSIEPNMIGIIGMGTGGYLAYAVNFLKDFDTELNQIKFQDPATGNPLVDTTLQSNLFGTTSTLLNIPNHLGYSSEFQVCVNIGGALGDSSWINAGEAPTISFHCTADANAPYNLGNVIVPTTGNVVIPDAAGSYLVSKIQDRLGNNNVFKGLGLTDPYTMRADMVNSGWEGFYPFVLPDTGGTYDCFGTPLPLQPQGSPWTWWDEQTFIQQWDGGGFDTVFNASGIASNCNQRRSNADMSPMKGRIYVDTMVNYMAPRLYRVFALALNNEVPVATNLSVYPNPATDHITIENSDSGNPIKEVAIFDQQGRLLFTRTGQGNLIRIQRQNWNRGLYIVRIKTQKGIANKKLLLN